MAGSARPRPLKASSPEELETVVRERCLLLLSQRPRTRAELVRSLTRAGAPEELVVSVLDRFGEVGLVDDAAYAQMYVRTGVQVRRRGTRSLRAELRGRGVSTDLIDAAAAEVDEEEERATALALARRRVSALSRFEPQVQRRRLTGLLLRRGFSSTVVSAVLAEVLDASEFDDDDGSFTASSVADLDDVPGSFAGSGHGRDGEPD